MRCLVSCHHLTCIGKDGGGEEAEGVDTCVKKKYKKGEQLKEREGMCTRCNQKLVSLFLLHTNGPLHGNVHIIGVSYNFKPVTK